jgi:ectoine hydroxylase-related dioxygenase (phytanoyl-CoA dioxygenase family)
MHVRSSGFAIVEDVLDRQEISGLATQLEHELTLRSRAGARNLVRLPVVRDLANDPRLVDLAAIALGTNPIPFRATLFDKAPQTNWSVAWHQDRALPFRSRVERTGWGPWSVKGGVNCALAPASALEQIVALRVHLDDSICENGPLRVLPGTHDRGVLLDAEIARMSQEVPPVECLTQAGGVVVMRPLLVHASSKSRDIRPRRVLHVEYAATLTLEPDLELAVC